MINRRQFLKYTGSAIVVLGAGNRSIFAEVKKPKFLIVRSWGGTWQKSLHIAVSEPFRKKYGITILYDNTEDNVIQPKLKEAISQGKQPPIDINWDTTTNAMKSALWGLSEPLTEGVVPNLKNLTSIAKPELTEGWPFVSVYSYTSVLAYRTDIVKERPTSWMMLLDKRWRKSVGLYEDGFGFTAVAVKLGGGTIPDNMEPAWEFYRRLKPNIGLLGGDETLTQALKDGGISLTCTVIANALQAKRTGVPVNWVVPKEGVVLQRDALWVPKNLPPENTYWAMEYIDFALSKEAQEVWCGRLGTLPVNRYASVPNFMKADPAFPTSEEKIKRMIVVPSRIRVMHEKKWFKKFREIMAP
jgi:putative spermidine/putrescine transport system substrate-binding protein